MSNYVEFLVEEIHSAVVATISDDGLPQTRVIDLMLYDEEGIYFLTAKGKSFCFQLLKQGYISLSAVKGKKSVSLSGRVKSIGQEKLDEIFIKNPYMQSIYPVGTRSALEVFCLYEGRGEYFDISTPSEIVRESFTLGGAKAERQGYIISDECIGCGSCISVCPQKCISEGKPYCIDERHCLSCGNCLEVCPVKVVKRL